MSRWLPFPLMSAGLLAMWLLLWQSVSPGQIAIGCIVAIAGPRWMASLELPPRAFRFRAGTILRLSFIVLADIVRSNAAVARIILRPGRPSYRSGFLDIPLDMRNPYGLTVLACIVTSTPGTLWVRFDTATGILTLHVLDLTDESEWVRTIKDRYERPLMEIFR
jgi:multicomponent K+:H+ antiporter subunit E